MQLSRWLLTLTTLLFLAGPSHAMPTGLTALLLPNLFGPETSSAPERAGGAEESEVRPQCESCWLSELLNDGMQTCRMLLGQGRFEEASDLARKLTRLCPRDAAADALRCVAEQMVGRCRAAGRCAEAAACSPARCAATDACEGCPAGACAKGECCAEGRCCATVRAAAKNCACGQECNCCKDATSCGAARAVQACLPGLPPALVGDLLLWQAPPPAPLPPPPPPFAFAMPPCPVPPCPAFMPPPPGYPGAGCPALHEELQRLVGQRREIAAAIDHLQRELIQAVHRRQHQPAATPVALNAQQVHLVTRQFEAHCGKLTCLGSPDRLLLEGDVRLTWKNHGQHVQLRAQRVVIDVQGGTFNVGAETVSAPYTTFGVQRLPMPVHPAAAVLPAPQVYAPPAPYVAPADLEDQE